MKEDYISSYRTIDAVCLGSAETHSKGIGVDQDFIVSVEKSPEYGIFGAAIYDITSMQKVGFIQMIDDEIVEIQTALQCELVIIGFRLKSGRFAVFNFRSTRAQ